MPKPLALTALGAFLVVDALLIALVYQHVNQDPPPSDIEAAFQQVEPTPTGPVSTQVAFDFRPATAGLVDLANDGTWVFATRGRCDGRGSPSVWTSSASGADAEQRDPGLASVQGVYADGDGTITLVGADDQCAVQQVQSLDGGQTWQPLFEVDRWAVAPDDQRAVVSPSGERSEPGCTVSSLSPLDDDFARVTCVDGIIKGTGNGGDEWVDLGRLDNVRTASFSTFNAGYALARFEGCAAQVFVTRDSGRSWAPVECLPGDPARAVTANDTTLVVVTGQDPEIYLSEDAGEEFTQP